MEDEGVRRHVVRQGVHHSRRRGVRTRRRPSKRARRDQGGARGDARVRRRRESGGGGEDQGAGEPAGGQRGRDAHEERHGVARAGDAGGAGEGGSGAAPLVAAVGWRILDGSSMDRRRPAAHPRVPRARPTRRAHPRVPPDAVERRERDSNHPGLRAVAAAPVRPQGRDPAAGGRRRRTNGRRSSSLGGAAGELLGRRELRALPSDVPRPSNPGGDGRPRGVGRAGRRGCPGAGD